MLLVYIAVILHSVLGEECRDNHRYCPIWAESGMCDPRVDNGYVVPNCRKSCGSCVDTSHLYLTMIKPLRSHNLKEGDSLLLEARAKGNPNPRTKIEFSKASGERWVLDSTVLEGDDGTIIVSYHIPEVGLEDSGVYIATFENSIAREETRSLVNITERIREPKLEIIRGLESKTEVKNGEFLVLEVEVESDVTPDYSEMYHYRDDQWVKVTDFDFYSVIPGRFIGRYQVVSAISENSGEYMFTVGNKHLVRKSFGRVTVLTKQVLLEFRENPGNISLSSGDSLSWSIDVDFYPDPPTILVYKVQDYLWTKVEENLKIGRSRNARTGALANSRDVADSRDVITATYLTVQFFKEEATPEDEGQYVILAAGNDLNRKLTFWVKVEENLEDEITNDLRELEEFHSFDNNFDDVPSGFIEPQFAEQLSNVSGLRGHQVKLNVVAFGSDKFRLSIYKAEAEEDLLLAAASPSVNSNWLNLTYVIDNLQPINAGLYKAVLSSGPVKKTASGWVEMRESDTKSEKVKTRNPLLRKMRIT